MYNNATIGDLMTLTSVQNNRNSNRLRGYDYALAGAYFVTIVTYQHQCLFGEIINGEVTLSPLGLIAYEQWQRLGKRFTKADFSTFVIMPNHVHGIIQLWGAGEKFDHEDLGHLPLRPYPRPHVIPGSLGAIVRAYKA